MTLTVQSVGAYLQRRLDGEPSVDLVTLCNSAGRHLTAMHAWEWLVRAPASLSVVAGRTEVALPSDFGRVVKLESAGNTLNRIQMTSEAQLLELETSTVALSNIGYWAAVSWKRSSDGLRPVLRVWPAPSASATDAMTLYYYAAWEDVEQDSDQILIPSFMDAVFLEFVFAFAQSYDENDLGSLARRLAEVHASPLTISAMQFDGQAQDEHGELRNGVGNNPNTMYQYAQIVGGPS